MKNFSSLTQHGIEAVLEAGQILTQGFGSVSQKTFKSGKHNFATQFDFASEASLINSLSAHYPTHAFLGEESGSKKIPEAEITWIIDPLDGTLNFAHHIPVYCISVAAVDQTGILAGIIYQPMSRELFVAERGKGAYLNGKKMQVSKTKNLEEGLAATKFLRENHPHFKECLALFTRVLKKGAVVRNTGSSALNLAHVASGSLDAYWAESLNSWDIAAGLLLIQEAGGISTNYKGKIYDLFSDDPLVASNGLLHDELLKSI